MRMFISVVLLWAGTVAAQDEEHQEMQESDVFLAGQAFSKNESENLGLLYKWLDDIMWTELWDSQKNRQIAYAQLDQLAGLAAKQMPALAFPVGQALYSYFWFADNLGQLNYEAALRSVELHEVALNYSNCNDLTMGVGSFLANACTERWLFLIMLLAEVGSEMAENRIDLGRAGNLLTKAEGFFQELMPYPFFSFRNWKSIYDVNTNSHVFTDGVVAQKPIWPKEKIPLAMWLEENYQTFRDDLDYIVQNDLFDTLYFAGHVSMTQFSGKRESWAPLNLIHNRVIAPHACKVANKTCELLLSRPEIANCHARDVGAAFARLQPGMGIKPHFWTAPPRMGVHLGLLAPPGATMHVGGQFVDWKAGEAVVFDDTYIHSVKHRGTEARYLLIAWFCHPCDDVHAEVRVQYPEGLCHGR